jgi:hypothetical protein
MKKAQIMAGWIMLMTLCLSSCKTNKVGCYYGKMDIRQHNESISPETDKCPS